RGTTTRTWWAVRATGRRGRAFWPPTSPVGDRLGAGPELVDADDGVAGQASEEGAERALQGLRLLRLEGDPDLVLRVGELRVGAAEKRRELAHHRVQMIGQRALSDADVDAAEQERTLAKALLDRVELPTKDLRHSGKDEDVTHGQDRDDQRVHGQELGAFGNL